MASHSTGRSRVLGAYFRLKGVLWVLTGGLLWWASWKIPGFGAVDEARVFAAFLLAFAAPGVLLWVVGTLVRYRSSLGWWLGMAYLVLVIASKTGLGIASVPDALWQKVAHSFPPERFTGLVAIGVLSAVVFALDVAALVALISPRGRDCFGIGPPNPAARV